jgi:hypothetical protein
MSNETENKEIERNVPLEDPFLQILVDFANKNEFPFGITLNVGGFLISGTLISRKRYFEGFGEDFATVFNNVEATQSIKKAFAELGDISKDEQKEFPPPTYIHLKDAKFFNTTGKPIPGDRGVWWRGQISKVQGFVLGSLREAED